MLVVALMQSLGGPLIRLSEPLPWLQPLLWGVLYALVYGSPFVAYWALTRPLRRQERARLFLDVVETCVEQGQSVERALTLLAGAEREKEERHGGFAAPLLARFPTYLSEAGMPFFEAIRHAPDFVPPQIAEMLQIGCEVGDLRKVLPACRRTLTGATSRMRGAMNYLVVLASGFFFVGLAVVLGMLFLTLPRYEGMWEDMALPARFRFWPWAWVLFLVALVFALFVVACAVFYVGGARLVARLRLRRLGDRLAMWLPWRRKQLQRDFSAMLAVLLDAEVPEPKAVELAAAATANGVFTRRAWAAAEAIERGEPLTAAIGRLDDAGELKWRLANAAHGSASFLDALTGWLDALEAKAFQQEQTAAQVITTALVLGNGLVVALLALGVFHPLLFIMRTLLW